jgi:hypothetical protein
MRGKVRRAKRLGESVVCACPKGETADLSTPLRSPGVVMGLRPTQGDENASNRFP